MILTLPEGNGKFSNLPISEIHRIFYLQLYFSILVAAKRAKTKNTIEGRWIGISFSFVVVCVIVLFYRWLAVNGNECFDERNPPYTHIPHIRISLLWDYVVGRYTFNFKATVSSFNHWTQIISYFSSYTWMLDWGCQWFWWELCNSRTW